MAEGIPIGSISQEMADMQKCDGWTRTCISTSVEVFLEHRWAHALMQLTLPHMLDAE